MLDITWHPNDRQLRVFSALSIAFGFALGTLVYLRTDAWTTAVLFVSAFAALGIGGLAQPGRLRWFYVLWMAIVFPIGWMVSLLVMGIAFYVVLTPIGWTRRVIRRDPLEQEFSPDATTYWQQRTAPTDTDRYFRQF